MKRFFITLAIIAGINLTANVVARAETASLDLPTLVKASYKIY